MSSFWTNQRVCVTGGSGFLGYHLVKQLLENGARVRVLSLKPHAWHPLWQLPVERDFGNILDASFVGRALEGCQVVFHTAGFVAVWGPALKQVFPVHVEGTRNVLQEAPRQARIVHTSSVFAVGGGKHGEIFDEDSPFNLDRVRVDYVYAKQAAEELALQAAGRGRNVVIVNPGNLVGPEDHDQSVMGRFCSRFWKGRMPVAPPGGFNFVDVRDVAQGHLLAAEKGKTGRRYILGGENHTLKEFMYLLAQAGGMKPRAIPRLPHWALTILAALSEGRSWWTGKEPYPAFQHARLNRYLLYYQSDRARRELGYRTRPLLETLADTYHWSRDHGLAPLRGTLNHWWLRPSQEHRDAA